MENRVHISMLTPWIETRGKAERVCRLALDEQRAFQTFLQPVIRVWHVWTPRHTPFSYSMDSQAATNPGTGTRTFLGRQGW